MENLQPQLSETLAELDSEFQYIDPAPHDEVMMEQLEYLLLHCRSGRHTHCAECARLDKVSRDLMLPFY